MKFSSVLKGKRAERACFFPVLAEDGTTTMFACVAVPLTSEEEGAALAFAFKYAKAKGMVEPAPGAPLYDLAYMAAVVASAMRDPDAGEAGKRPPTFANEEEILGALSRETLTYLYAIVEEWCDECSPTMRMLSDAAMFAATKALADDDEAKADRAFFGLGPSMLKRYARFSARLLWPLLEVKSEVGGPSESSPPTSPTSSSA